MAKLPGAYELMATAASPAINFGRGLLGYQDPFITQTMQDRMTELEAGRTKGNIGYEDYGLQTATPGGRFTGGLMDLALNNPVDFGLAGSIGRYSFSPQGRTGLNYDFTPDQDTGSTGSAMLDFINAGGLKGAFSKMGQAQAAEITPSNTGIMSTPYTDRIMDPGSMRSAAYRSIENEPYQEIPGFNFIDAPTSLSSRISNPQFLNNPRTGIIDNLIMKRGNPNVNLMTQARDAITSGVGKGIDLGKTAIGGILSLVSGIPGIGVLANMLPERDYRQGAIEDFYGDEETQALMSQIPGMENYNIVSGGLFGSPVNYGLSRAIDKRMATIRNTLEKKKSTALEQRLKALEELKAREAKALEDARIKADKIAADKPSVNRDFGASRRGDSDISDSQRGGFATDDTAGFFKNGGLVGLL